MKPEYARIIQRLADTRRRIDEMAELMSAIHDLIESELESLGKLENAIDDMNGELWSNLDSEQVRTLKLLHSRYGTYTPSSIRDFFYTEVQS